MHTHAQTTLTAISSFTNKKTLRHIVDRDGYIASIINKIMTTGMNANTTARWNNNRKLANN